VREALGLDRLVAANVGGAPIASEVIEFWHALGVPLSELWGLSETAGPATLNPPGDIRVGTVGLPLPGTEVVLADDGEVLVRGPGLMRGYRNLPEQTGEAIDADGWLHTGDVGAFDDDGYLQIVDRKKELMINAAGKNMSPASIEAKLKSAHPLIGHAVAVGDGRPYNVALIVLDAEGARGSVPELARSEDVRAEIAAAVERANARMARVEQIKRFALLPATWVPGGDELTPTMKLKRRAIAEKYRAEIEQLYSG
jgi:long-subunit acyl-CoA synthetase (AMP-forming)